MNKEIKAKWLKALRSGDYLQGHGALRTDEGYCCLGVLCDLHRIEVGGEWTTDDIGKYQYLDRTGFLPKEVMKWAGLGSKDPVVSEGMDITSSYNSVPMRHGLSKHNDGCGGVPPANFETIADLIEKRL